MLTLDGEAISLSGTDPAVPAHSIIRLQIDLVGELPVLVPAFGRAEEQIQSSEGIRLRTDLEVVSQAYVA
jgi:hypothetical protein